VSSDDLDAIEAKVRAAVEEATEAARAGAAPSLDLIDKDVWADGSTSWRN
jgi:TPP-dependent pyruvate/acetoin dehydrogenase alpha subunit